MRNIFIIFIVGISTIVTINTQAQFVINNKKLHKLTSSNQIIYYEKKKLSEKQIKRLQKREFIESIRAQYNMENSFLEKLISENWQSVNNPKGITITELSSKIRNKENTWYITLRNHTDRFFDRRVHKKNYYYNYSHYKLSIYNNKKVVLSIPLVDQELSELNAAFAIQQIQNLIEHSDKFKNKRKYTKEVNANAGSLSGKTLLISEKLTDYSETYLKNFFGGTIKIVPELEILEAVEKKDTKMAYLLITINDESDEPSLNHLIIDCSNNTPVLIYRNSAALTKPCKHTCMVHRHDDKLKFLYSFHFKKYQKIINLNLLANHD